TIAHTGRSLAAGLLSLGLKRGDRVGIWGPNSREWVVTQYAAARAGFILVNLNPTYLKNELEYSLKKVGCKALISATGHKGLDYYETLYNLIPELAASHTGNIKSHLLPDLKILIMMGTEKYRGTFNFDNILEAASSAEVKAIYDIQDMIQFDEPVNIQFTSGTTGFPKGATLTHHNMINNAFNVGLRLDYHNRISRICCPVPLYHCIGMVLACLQIPCHGSTVVFPSKVYDAGITLKAMQDERCTSVYGVPTMFIDMLNHKDLKKLDLTSLYTGIMAGSPCPIEIMQRTIDEMNMSEVTVCYGSTETSPVTFQSLRSSSVEKRVSTVGCVSDHVEAKVVDENGAIVPAGVTGELCTRGYTTMLGYWKDEGKTAEVIKPDRWFYTGDLAVMDEEGFCSIVGRLKDMVIRGGENIYPTEIEQLLYHHPKVKDVQVIGVPDERLGEELCAWIQLKAGETLTETELRDFCKQRLARFKVPRYFLFVDEFPMTVSGKIQKFKMREKSMKLLKLDHLHPH
ncbi:acyl-CoA synthetase family member 2, mitochondrial-like, partial [Pomacea canaliculata]|uniref:acyl-CoA synthetase family member 2, mitochondrial-like n=1 Tax=Pomacea canaliculata TaxID=400727 RepID=UPI000D728741